MGTLSITERAGKKFLIYHVGTNAEVFEVAISQQMTSYELVGKTVTKGPDWKWGKQGGLRPKGLVLEVHPEEDG